MTRQRRNPNDDHDNDDNDSSNIDTELYAIRALDDFLTYLRIPMASKRRVTIWQERRHGLGFAFKAGGVTYVILNLENFNDDSPELEDLLWWDDKERRWGVFRSY